MPPQAARRAPVLGLPPTRPPSAMEVFQHRCCYRTGWVFAHHPFLRPSARRRRRPGHALPDLIYHPDRPVPQTPMLITEADWVRQLCDYSSPPELNASQIRTGLKDLKKADLIYRCALRGLPTQGLVDDLQSRLTTWASRRRAADATDLHWGSAVSSPPSTLGAGQPSLPWRDALTGGGCC